MEEFKIIAQTYSLKDNNSSEYNILLDGKKSFLIPIYQRPYSWKRENVEKLLKDLIDSYQNSNNEVIKEPIFIGTMQLSKPNNNEYKIIDGQQRLTTIIILFIIKLFIILKIISILICYFKYLYNNVEKIFNKNQNDIYNIILLHDFLLNIQIQ